MGNTAYNLGSSSGSTNVIFKTLSAAGQSDIAADSVTDTLVLSAMGSFEILTHPGTDTLILSAGAGGGGGGTYDLTDFDVMMIADVFR